MLLGWKKKILGVISEEAVMFQALGVVLLFLGHPCLGLEVTAPPSVVAVFRSPAVLPCTFRIAAPSINPQFLAIIWYYGDKELVRIDNKEKVEKEGFSLNEQEARKGTATLTIHKVAIADQGTYKCLIIYSPDREQREIRLDVYAPPQLTIQRKALRKDEKNQLYCSISDFFPGDFKVTWLRNNIQIWEGSEMGALQTNADGTYSVNSSVVLNPAQIQDRPTIVCQVEHVSLQRPIQDAYTVQFGVAPKVRLVPSRTSDNNELIYVCEARGFSPEPLSINWQVNGKSVDLSRESEDGVFNKKIYYQINRKEGNVPDRISCSVQHETLISPVIETVEVSKYNECTRNCHLGLIVVLLLLLIASLLFIAISGYLIIKKKYSRRFEVSHIHQEQTRAEDDMVTLYCMALNCPTVAQATWTVSTEGQEPITVSDCQGYKDEEKGPLLHRDYTVRTDHIESKGLSNYTTKLSFNPQTSAYKKVEVICKFVCGRRSKERRHTCTFLIRKPEMRDSIRMFIDDKKDVVCSVTLEKFYPRNIQIQWSYGGDIESTEEITHNTEDHTYKAVSKCKIPRESVQNSSRVRVTWKHQSMDHPESREMTLADIPQRPVMGGIVVPSLVHGTEAKLQCNIRGYFPKDLKVTWLWREAGKSDLYQVSSSDKYKIPVWEATQQPDKTYTCTASLIVSVSAITEHGSEFICRVTHPSLEIHLEKRTGELSVKGFPVIEMEYKDKILRAKILNFRPNNINVTWSRKEKNDNKMKNYESKEIRVVKELSNGDGTFTSIREISVHDSKDYKIYQVTVEHETLKSPATKIIVREKGIFYLEENGQKIELTN